MRLTLPGSAAVGSAVVCRPQDHRAGPLPHYRSIPPLDKRPARPGPVPVSQASSSRGEFHPRLLLLPWSRSLPPEAQIQKQMTSWRTSYKPFDSRGVRLGATYSSFVGSSAAEFELITYHRFSGATYRYWWLVAGALSSAKLSRSLTMTFRISDGLIFDVWSEAEVCIGAKIVPRKELFALQPLG